jgi:phosphocarrier protein HPr
MNGDSPTPTGGICRTVTIINRRGLHARAAAKFVKLVNQFEAEVTVTKSGTSVSGRSIMGLMMLAASPGTEIDVRACGNQSKEALTAIVDLIERKFDEDE